MTTTIKQQQIAALLQTQLGNILLKEGRNLYGGNTLVTITQVRVTPDLLTGRVYVSVYPAGERANTISVLAEYQYYLRKLLGAQIKNKIRRIPELEFYLDDTMDEVFKMEKILGNLQDERHNRDQHGYGDESVYKPD